MRISFIIGSSKRGEALFTYVLYGAAGVLLLISAYKSKIKTKQALKKALKSLENILPQLLSILLLIGGMLAVLDQDLIARLLGASSGVVGMILAGVLGSITLIPGFAAFPLAASLLKNGAGYGQIAMFVSTLMMVGIVTLPMEFKFFGKQTALKRNLFALIFSVLVAIVMGGSLR